MRFTSCIICLITFDFSLLTMMMMVMIKRIKRYEVKRDWHTSSLTQNKTLSIASISVRDINKSPNIFSLTAIDGGYSDWSECSGCTLSCGGGTQTLVRTCTNPPPSDGGKNCSELGPAYKLVSCNEQECRKYFDLTLLILIWLSFV